MLLVLGACESGGGAAGGETDSRQPTVGSPVLLVDDAGDTLRLERPARRVVSLVPSATDALLALGARDAVVGRTDYDRGAEVAALPSVGGGLDPNLEALVALRPEVVVGWGSDKSPELRDHLARLGVPYFAVSPQDTADIFHNLQRLGAMVGRDSAAAALSARLRSELAEVRASVAGREPRSVFYVVWNDPPITAGPDTFIAQLIELAGGRSVFPDVQQPWPQVSMEEIVRRQPDVVVLPVGEDQPHASGRLEGAPGWRELRAVREGRVVEVPTDLMNRPGPGVAEAARRMRAALYPELEG